MTDPELESLLDDLESDRVERKESSSDGDRIRQVICAFANDLPGHDRPGVLFIGVNDNGKPIGLAITDQEHVPSVVEKERFSAGACHGGRLWELNNPTEGEPRCREFTRSERGNRAGARLG